MHFYYELLRKIGDISNWKINALLIVILVSFIPLYTLPDFYIFSSLQCFPSYLYFHLLHFSKTFHAPNFPDIFQVYISHIFSFPDIFQLHISHISHTYNFPIIFQFHICQSFNFLDYFPFSFSKIPYFQFFQFPLLFHSSSRSIFHSTLRYTFTKLHLIFISLYNFPKFYQQNKYCFTPTLFPTLHLPAIYFLPAILVLQSFSRSRHTLSAMSRPWSRTVSLIFFQFHIVHLIWFLSTILLSVTFSHSSFRTFSKICSDPFVKSENSVCQF